MVLDEEEGDSLDGSADSREQVESTSEEGGKRACDTDKGVTITNIGDSDSKQRLKDRTSSDKSLKSLRSLADRQLNGYTWKDGLLMRQRLDEIGKRKSQICLLSDFRQQVLQMAHEGFGHQGKTKMTHHVQKGFYCPSLWRNVSAHCRSCETCQRVIKTKPRQAPIVEREILTVPFERVCIDVYRSPRRDTFPFSLTLT